MRKIWRHTGGVVLAVFLLGSPVTAQFSFPEGHFDQFSDPFHVDYAYFRSDDSGMVRLELYYQVHHKGLEFTASGGNLTAAYELNVRVMKDDRVVESFNRDRQVVLGADEEFRTRTDFRSSQLDLVVEPGDYKVNFQMRDKTSGKQILGEMDIDIEELIGDHPRLSAVEFVQTFNREGDSTSIFAKGDMTVVPSVHRVYGSLDANRVAFYFEVYSGREERDKVVLETKIRHYRRGMIYRDTLHVPVGDSTLRQLREVSLAEFLPGTYELEITVRGRRNKELDRLSTEFTVAWTEEGMIRNDWESTVSQLNLFSEDVDVGDLEDIEGYANRLLAFQQFWRERDPTVGTAENEAKIAFYYRIGVANARFGVMRMDGWRTDRGRIYIRYGEPDYLTDEPFAIDQRPYQIWHYVRLVPVRHFVFIDENEDGDYRLQYPYDGIQTGFTY